MAEIYSVDLVGLSELQAGFRKAPAIVIEELDKAMDEVTWLLLRETSEITPVVLGILKQSEFGVVEVSETGVLGIVGSPLNYALPVEIGRKPRARRLSQGKKETAKGFERRKERAGPNTEGFDGRRMFALALASQDEYIDARFKTAVETIFLKIGGAS